MAVKKEEKKVNKYLLLFGIIALVCAMVFIYYLFRVNSITVINFDVKIGDHIAFNLDPDKIHFGMITPGGYAFRDVYVTSNEKVKVVGKTLGFKLEFDKNNFILEKDKKELIRLTARPTSDQSYGLYTGKVILLFLKVK